MNIQKWLQFAPEWSLHAARALDDVPLWLAPAGLLLLDEVPLRRARRVLNVNCRFGFPLIELAERLGPGVRVHGLDSWPIALERAAEKIGMRELRNIRLHEGDARSMPFPGARFDLIVSDLGASHWEDLAGLLQECRRVAKPGAVLALTTPLPGLFQEFYTIWEEVLATTGEPAARGRLREYRAESGSLVSLRGLLEESGFSVVREVERTSRMRFANGRALLNHYFIKYVALDSWKRIVGDREVEVFEHLLDRLDGAAQRQGGLALTIPLAYVEGVAACCAQADVAALQPEPWEGPPVRSAD